MACVCVPYALKIIERLDGDAPTVIDAIRDFGLAAFFIGVIAFHVNRFDRL